MSKRKLTDNVNNEIIDVSLTEYSPHPSPKKREGNDLELCQRCRKIKLDAIIEDILAGKWRPTKHTGMIVCRLGSTEDWSLHCQLCRFFHSVTGKECVNSSFVLRVVTRAQSDERFCRGKQGYWGVKVVGQEEETEGKRQHSIDELNVPLLAVTKHVEHDVCASGDLGHGLKYTGYISWLTKPETFATPGRGRLLDCKRADFELVESWLKFCCEYHIQDCAVPTSDEIVEEFQLIDCDSLTIVKAGPEMQYLALSYVWGTPGGGDSTTAKAEKKKFQWDHLPQTVHDAIVATQRLGYRYIWVDRYCIPSDPKIELAQIQKMDIIYNRAQATILAVAGEDAAFGLPGIGTRLRKEQPTAEVGGYTLFSTLSDAAVVVKDSKWTTRGWTYQEAMLSRRRIFFTDQQVYFECQSMQCMEALPPNLQQFHTPDNLKFREETYRPIFELSGLNLALFDIWAYIAAYSRRSLTDPNDSLNGFLGILAFLESVPNSTLRSFWGVPVTLTPDRFTRGRVWDASHCFLYAVLWQHKTESKRRPHFPSWSWTGWEGAFASNGFPAYTGCECQWREDNDIETVLGAETEDGGFMDWEALRPILSARIPTSELPRILHIHAQTVSLRIKRFPVQTEAIAKPGYYVYACVGDVRLERIGRVKDCTAYASLHLNSTETVLQSRLENQEFTGMLLGCSKENRQKKVLVLDKREDGIYERIGIVDMKSSPIFHGVAAQAQTINPVLMRALKSATWLRPGDIIGSSTGEVFQGRAGLDKAAAKGAHEKRVFQPSVELEDWKLKKTWRTIRLG